ncbi:MAG: hypothetical protein NT023_13925, partial [Armatimonadetes bacterium]|nr:hypothetical protein [Armatimonadota bacterium]
MKIRVLGGKNSGRRGVGNYWAISYSEIDSLFLAINSKSGAVVGFSDAILEDALDLLPAKAWEECISADTATSRAWEYLKNTGMDLSDVVVNEIRPVEQSNGATQGSMKWDIYFKRIFNGVPLYFSDFWVVLDATEGRLIRMSGNTDRDPLQDG